MVPELPIYTTPSGSAVLNPTCAYVVQAKPMSQVASAQFERTVLQRALMGLKFRL